jgi:hypothetical protein
MAITLELSDDKWRKEADLPEIWGENKDALVDYALTASLGGARGSVTGAGGRPVAATLHVKGAAGGGKPVPFYSDPATGFYARPLAPGRHLLVVAAEGHEPAEAEVVVPEGGAGVVKDFKLAVKGSGGSAAAPAAASPAAAAAAAAVPAAVPAGRSADGRPTAGAAAAASSGGGGGGSGGAAGEDGGGDDAGKMGASIRILLIHAAVFVAIGAASSCQSSGLIQALAGARLRRLASPSRFDL